MCLFLFLFFELVVSVFAVSSVFASFVVGLTVL